MKMFNKLRVVRFAAATFVTALLLAGCEQVSLTDTGAVDAEIQSSRSVVFANGNPSGTVRATINIYDESDLQLFASTVLRDPDTDGVLMDDIVLENPWIPIGKDNSGSAPVITAYTGIFDGGGYTISGLNVTETTSFIGFFALNNGIIKNLTLEGTVTANVGSGDIDYVGGVAGYNDIGGTVQNVISQVTVTAIDDTMHNIGGIAGFNGWDEYNPDSPHYKQEYQTGGIVYRCRNEGAVSGGFNKVGGIVGENAWQVTECVNKADITCLKKSSGWPGVGGIVGRNGNNNEASERGTILNCYNWGTINDQTGASSSHRAYGGITGWCNDISYVINCYDTAGFTQSSGSLTAEKNPIIGMTDTPDISRSDNNYSLEGIYAYNKGVVFYTGTVETQAYMQTQTFVNDLNSGSTPGKYVYVAGGYPKLNWE
jgi:hypothetical protein